MPPGPGSTVCQVSMVAYKGPRGPKGTLPLKGPTPVDQEGDTFIWWLECSSKTRAPRGPGQMVAPPHSGREGQRLGGLGLTSIRGGVPTGPELLHQTGSQTALLLSGCLGEPGGDLPERPPFSAQLRPSRSRPGSPRRPCTASSPGPACPTLITASQPGAQWRSSPPGLYPRLHSSGRRRPRPGGVG